MRSLVRLCLVAIAIALCATQVSVGEAFAKPNSDVTIAFTAVVEGTGEVWTGAYTYNLNTPDENSAPTVGDYQHTDSKYGITIKSGGTVIAKTDPDNVNFLVEIVNDHGEPASDNYLLRSYNNIGASHISWQLDDPTLKALKSDNLTKQAPKLSDWQSFFGLYVEFSPDVRQRAHVTQVRTI